MEVRLRRGHRQGMTDTVLLAYDGSVGARQAIRRTAALLARGHRAVVLYVQPPVVGGMAPVAGPGVPVYAQGARRPLRTPSSTPPKSTTPH